MSTPKRTPVAKVGLVGLGLMGRGIATCLLGHGLTLTAYNRTASRASAARRSIAANMQDLAARDPGLAPEPAGWEERLTITSTLDDLAGCSLVIESVQEDLLLKRGIYARLEDILGPNALIASNTSSFPVALLQEGRRRPGRFIVMHWAEPAWITRYLEIVPGEKTTARCRRLALEFALSVGKEATLLKRDVRGFISNRLMYAMMREACHLEALGVADRATIDRSFRNDIGCWATIAGPFRWMDLTGIGSYAAVMKGLFPELSDSKELPAVMRQLVDSGAEGIANGRGFYDYSRDDLAHKWEEAWVDFSYDIRMLVEKYEKRIPL